MVAKIKAILAFIGGLLVVALGILAAMLRRPSPSPTFAPTQNDDGERLASMKLEEAHRKATEEIKNETGKHDTIADALNSLRKRKSR
jgi:hypothetical protein